MEEKFHLQIYITFLRRKRNEKYSNYDESEEYMQMVEKFIQDINTKSRVIAPDKSEWDNHGSWWCMVITKEMVPVNCESTMLSTEKLIETKGNVPVGTHLLE